MEELMDLLVNDESPSQVSDKIKDILYSKSAEKITNVRLVIMVIMGMVNLNVKNVNLDARSMDGSFDLYCFGWSIDINLFTLMLN